jgi:methylthioribose-1-phosphate isomerase
MAKRPASDRRSFLRSIANDGAATAGSLFGALGALRGQAQSIGADLQTPAREAGAEPTRRRAAETHLDMPGDAGLIKAGAAAPEPAFASPIRDEEGAVIVLDVRALPAVIAERRATSASSIAALLTVDAIAPGPIRGLAAAFALALAGVGSAGGRVARIHAAAAALRNAAPLAGSLHAELDALLPVAVGGESLDAAIAARAATQLGHRAAYGKRIAATLKSAGLARGAIIASGPALGATAWGDLAPLHEALRHLGVRTFTIGAGPTVDVLGAARLGAIDAADAVRAGLTPRLLEDGQLASEIANADGAIGALILGSDAVSRAGYAVVPAGGVGLAAAALFSGVPVYLVAGSAATDLTGAELTKRVVAVNNTAAQRGTPFSARGVTSGVQVATSRVELLALDGITLID